VKYQSIRGTKDILPIEALEWQRIEALARDLFAVYGYMEIRTPIIEETGLFVKSVGEDTDIVKKEMFSFVDRGEREISLRPEGTAPIVRAYLENSLDKTDPFQKLYYIGPMFRAERPQAGRLRQFHQAGVEAIGSNSPALDAEVITLMARLLEAIGIKDYVMKLNNLGCREDKKKLSGLLKETFSRKETAKLLCDDCKRRAGANPLRLLDCKSESCRAVVRKHFREIDFLCGDCKANFDEVQKFLKLSGVRYAIDPFIVRGLDYYTRTVFEAVCDKLGAQNAVGAGGRYDNLISQMGGPETGACGFALGVDRMLLAISPRTAEVKKNSGWDLLYIAALGEAARVKGFTILNDMRSSGIASAMTYEDSSLKSQMRAADKLEAKFVLIIGDDEIKKGEAALRNMETKEQVSIRFDDMVKVIKDKIKRC